MASQISMPSEADLKKLPQDERLMQAAKAAEAATSVQGIVDSLRSKAGLLTNPKERERVLSEAYDREIEAKGLSKKAKVLQSGAFQGAVGGGGIGVATGAGLGTVVGTLVGTVASVPTTAIGGLVGAGTGALHGPWIKLGGKKKDGDAEDDAVQVPQEAIESGAVQIDDKTGQATVKDQAALKTATIAEQARMASTEQKVSEGTAGEKRKPKKLEVRANKQAAPAKPQPSTDASAKMRKKPAKLEVRSKKAG